MSLKTRMPKNKNKAKKPIFGPLGPILGAIWPQNWILHLKLQLKTVSDSILVVLWFLAENVNCCPESNPPQCEFYCTQATRGMGTFHCKKRRWERMKEKAAKEAIAWVAFGLECWLQFPLSHMLDFARVACFPSSHAAGLFHLTMKASQPHIGPEI